MNGLTGDPHRRYLAHIPKVRDPARRRPTTVRNTNMGALWHPFSNMSMVEKNGEFTLVRGEGCYVFDADGKRYLDATAGLWYANVGHGRVELADIAAKQMAALASYNIFGDYSNEPAVALAEKIAGIAPMAGLPGLPDLRRLGLGRHGGQARPSLLGRDGAAEPHPHHRAAEGLPRHALRGHGALRSAAATARATASWSRTPPPSPGTAPTSCARRSSGSGRTASPRSTASR